MSGVVARVETARLVLVPGALELAEAELQDRARLAALLGARVPEEWPPESVRDALPIILAHARAGGAPGPWSLGWYALWRADEPPTLCASVGFKGAPREGVVEIGYSVLPAFQRRGVATEMVRGLVAWAFAQREGVVRVDATVEAGNAGSIGVLRRCGFVREDFDGASGLWRYALRGDAGQR